MSGLGHLSLKWEVCFLNPTLGINFSIQNFQFKIVKFIIPAKLGLTIHSHIALCCQVHSQITTGGRSSLQNSSLLVHDQDFKSTQVRNISRKMNKGSHGIGLSVCKSIAKNLKGDLILNEDVKNGCQFCLSLTLKKVASP